MQDITLSRRHPQDNMRNVRPATRPNSSRSRPASRVTYVRSARTMSDVFVDSTPIKTVTRKPENITTVPAAQVQPVEALSLAAQSRALERALASAKSALRAEHQKRRNIQRWVLVGLIGAVVLVTGSIIVTTVLGLD